MTVDNYEQPARDFRAETERDYTVDAHGVIRSPGKFEGEGVWAPYYYAAMMGGLGDPCWDDDGDEDSNAVSFEIEPGERAAFPELGTATTIRLWIGDDGFVHCENNQ